MIIIFPVINKFLNQGSHCLINTCIFALQKNYNLNTQNFSDRLMRSKIFASRGQCVKKILLTDPALKGFEDRLLCINSKTYYVIMFHYYCSSYHQ